MVRPRYFADYWTLRPWVSNPWRVSVFREERRPDVRLEVGFRHQSPIELRSATPDHHMFHRIYVRDEYRLGRPGERSWGTVLDLGGNVGIFASRVSPYAERVLTFEPVPANFEQLSHNLSGYANVTPIPKGVSSKPATVTVYEPKHKALTGAFSMHSDSGGLMSDDSFDIEVVSLDSVFEEYEIDRCDLMKIDIEGHEYEVLYESSDSTLAKIQTIAGEYHDVSPEDPRTRIENFERYLQELGFRVDVVPHRKKPNHGMFFASR